MNIEEHRAERNKKLHRALITSLMARLAGIFLQVVSLPIAAAALGAELFSIYAMIGAVLTWLILSNLGIGQATTLEMAKQLGADNREGYIRIFCASWITIFAISIGVFLVTFALMSWTSIVDFVFRKYSDFSSVNSALIFVCIVFLFVQNLSVFEAAQLAFQKQDKFNISTTIGTGFAALSVYYFSCRSPSVLSILLSVHVPVLFFRILNAYKVWLDLEIGCSNFRSIGFIDVKGVVKRGLGFIAGTSLNNFLCHPFGILLVGLFSEAQLTASFAAVMNAITLILSAFSLLIIPLRGALPEAGRRGDVGWIKRTYTLTFAANFCLAIVPCLIFMLFGDWLFSVWYGGEIRPPKQLLVSSGVYMLCLAVESTNYNFLASLGKVGASSRWVFSKAIFSSLIVFVCSALGYADFSIWGLVLANFCLSMIPLNFMVIRLVAPSFFGVK